MDTVIDQATAELEFNRFLEKMRIDFECDGEDENEARDKNRDKYIFIREIKAGNLIVDEDGCAIYTPVGDGLEDHKAIKFYKPKGSALMASDKKKPTAKVAQMYSMMADMTRQPPSLFSKIDNSDLKVCLAITTLFLA